MKVTLQAHELAGLLGKVRGAVPGHTSIPILHCILIDAELDAGGSGLLRATASQADMQATATIACDVIEPGSFALPANAFSVIKSLGKASITFHTPQENRAHIDGARQRYDFATLPAGDFPFMSPVDSDDAVQFFMPAGDLRAALLAAIPNASEDFFNLAGVHMAREGRELVFVATDKHRFLHYRMAPPSGTENAPPVTIPSKAAKEACNLLTGVAGDVSVTVTKVAISIDIGTACLTSRLIAGDFVAYQNLTASAKADGFTVAAAEISEAVSRLVTMRVDTKVPCVTFQTNGTSVEITSDRRGRDAGFEAVDADIAAATRFSVSTRYFSLLVGMWPESAPLDIALTPTPYGNAVVIQSASVPAMKQIVMPMAEPKRIAAE